MRAPHELQNKESKVKHKKVVVVLVVVLAMTLGSMGVGNAIQFGWPDGEDHPYVGMMVADDADGPAWRCTGTLISPTVFLTAGHCVHGAVAARVWFDTDLSDNPEYPHGGDTSIEGTPIPHPDFTGALTIPQTNDVGVVILSEAVNDLGFGALPDIGLVEELNTAPGSEVMVNVVGYGLQSVKPVEIAERVRNQATPMLVEVSGSISGGWSIHLSSNPGKGGGTGGTCFGDSGGPALAEVGSNVVVGVGSFVLNSNCRGVGYYYRVDTEFAQEFINQFLP
jgi:hypothetical protein